MATDDTCNLIHGLLVQRLGFVTSAAALGAIEAWRGDMSRPLLAVFVERGLVSPDTRAVVETVTDQLVRTHGGEAAALTALVGVGVLPEDERTKSLPGATPQGTRYEILDELAHGGMGQVLRASDAVLGREVLVKQMLGEIAHDPPAQASFTRERQTAAALEHPNIGPVYDAGVHGDGRLYYVMRYIRGDTLKQAIERYHDSAADRPSAERALALRDLLGRFSAVCEAVSYAHARGVLHRDIKPANILLGDFGETQLIDWGLAKVGGEEIAAASGSGSDSGSGSRPVLAIDSGTSEPTRAGQAKGTPAFMAPEQAAGEIARIGPAADVYGLGATLYQLLTGVPPFDGRSPSVMQDVIRGVFPRPRRVAPSVPPALEAICLKAMARDPAARYLSAKALAADIGRWLGDEPVGIYRDPWHVRAGRFAKRHRTAVTAAGVLLATGLVALGVGNVLVRQQRDIAVAALNSARGVITILGKEIGDDAWAVIPNAELNRIQIVHEINNQYTSLLSLQPQNDNLLIEASDGYHREANLARILGRYADSDRIYTQAERLISAVIARDPNNFPAQATQLELRVARAVLWHSQADPRAGSGYADALKLAFNLQERFPMQKLDTAAARIKAEYGSWNIDDGKPEEGARLLREAVTVMAAASPAIHDGIDHMRMLLVSSLCALSRAEAESGDHAAAVVAAERAVAEAEIGVASARNPNHPDIVQVRAEALLRRALINTSAPERREDASRDATAAVETFRSLAKRNSKLIGHQTQLADALVSRAEIDYAAGRSETTMQDCDATLATAMTIGREGKISPSDVPKSIHFTAARAWLLKSRLLNDLGEKENSKQAIRQAHQQINVFLRGYPRNTEAIRFKKAIDEALVTSAANHS